MSVIFIYCLCTVVDGSVYVCACVCVCMDTYEIVFYSLFLLLVENENNVKRDWPYATMDNMDSATTITIIIKD